MTLREFDVFVAKFRKQFMDGRDEFDFVTGWQPKIMPFEPAELEYAIGEIAADPRIADKSHPASWVRNRLPLLLEYALEFRQRKQRAKEAEERRREDAEWAKKQKAGVGPSLAELAKIQRVKRTIGGEK